MPRKQVSLLSDHPRWFKLCSSLDALGDAEFAIASYSKLEKVEDDGEKYLILYGILQVLFVQQDSISHLMEALDIPYTPDSTLNRIREVRNNSIGHPTKRGKDKAFNFIVRISMSHTGFQLMTSHSDGQHDFTNVKVIELINSQRNLVGTALSEVIKNLTKEEKEHRETFRGKKLVACFPETIHYYFEKISESLSWERPNGYGAMHVDLITEAVARFKAELQCRGILSSFDSVIYHLGLIEYPSKELKKYFSEPEYSKLNQDDAYIFSSFLRKEIYDLIEIAKEIDSDYASDQIL